MKSVSLVFLICLNLFFSAAQQAATTSEAITQSLTTKQKLINSSTVKQVPFTNIGPTIMSGRVVDLAVNPNRPSEFYIGYASGGLWHTVNNGTTFSPIFDTANTQNVGSIAVHWPTRTIYVGTGENNASRSSYAGIGILKSIDNGKTWTNLGLIDAHHFAPILIHPKNPDIVTVGATGHLYSANKTRGIYKTTNGGKTWSQKLYIDDITGIIDLQRSPNDYNIMFATAWTKDRKAWNFKGNGENSGIYKSIDAGETWTKVSTKNSGFPTGSGVGRIGIAVFNDTTVYAIHDNQFRRVDNTTQKHNGDLTKNDFKTLSVSDVLNLDDKKLDAFLKTNGFHEKYKSKNVKQMLQSGNIKPIDIAKYLENANAMLFDTPVIGAEVYKSTNAGKTWQKTHPKYLDGIYFSYGYYFGHIHVSPINENDIYIYGVPILKSKDGGKTFTSIDAENVHVDHHALWINPKNPNHLINGNDGGVNISYDDGDHWIKNNTPTVGQFYSINIDHQKPYNVYGGLQDNGVWVGKHNAEINKAWRQQGQYPWTSIMGGDGMQIQIDNRNPNIVYTGYQFGNYFRLNRDTKKRTYIQPKHALGESPYRFNWQTPIVLSSHNQDILYLGGNKLMRSMDKGDHWETISNDLTQGGKKGNVAYGTLTSISESPFQFGLIYTGSDDGLVHITKNSGDRWHTISNSFPKDLWVSRIIASQHKKERVYVTLNGYRWDNFKTYVYKSDNYGKTWDAIASNLPDSPVNVIREDSEKENILYLGTDNGAYVSFNTGESWNAFSENLPSVAIHDIVIQPEEKHLLLGTHGRSIYKAEIAPLQQLSKPNQIFPITPVKHSSRWGSSWRKWSDVIEPKIDIVIYSSSKKSTEISIESENNSVIQTLAVNLSKGFNYIPYNLSITSKGRKVLLKQYKGLEIPVAENGQIYLPKGSFNVTMNTSTTPLIIE